MMRGRRRSKEELLECSTRVHKKNRMAKNEIGISDLPEHILHHIFSFLDIKQTIQTCVLSRKWRYFWISIPILKFNYSRRRGKGKKKGDFKDFVDRVLMFRGNSNIQGFVLVSDDRIIHLNTWILVCIIHNVQQLTLHTIFPEKFQFHHCLFTCKSLTKLVLRADFHNQVSLSLPYSVTLPSLKTLCLRSVKFEDEYSTNQLFSGCPILESLTIECCEFPHNINVNISSPLLQNLVIGNCRTTSNALDLGPVVLETNFQLCAPNLISFHWFNHISIHCDPKNLSSLVNASINVGDSMLSKEKKTMCAPFMVNLFRGLHNVEDLTLSASFLEVVTGAPDLLDSQPTEFCNLRCLMLEGQWCSVDCIHAISYLLKISPIIETLFVKVHYGAPDLLEVQPTQCCNLRCLEMNTMLSRDCIYAIAYFLKISPKIENLSFMLNVYASDKMLPYWNPDGVTSNSAKRGDCWEAMLLLEGLLNQVKCFELRNVTGRINELEFIEILLKNAMLLEELLIFFKIPNPYDTEKELKERRLAKFSKKVLTFPKASSNVVIIFKYVK